MRPRAMDRGRQSGYLLRMTRIDGRRVDEIRPVRITPNFTRSASGSALIECGNTRVICTASAEETVPAFLRDTDRGWVTAEYGMLPGSGSTRIARRAGGRTQEIQRLVGRSMRAIMDLSRLGPRTIWLDCDVIEADGGTRTASITGAYVALSLALARLRASGLLTEDPRRCSVAAISVGVVAAEVLLDLCYEEDSRADVDMNIVMTGDGRFIEVQGTAETEPFAATQMDHMIAMASAAIGELTAAQESAIAAGLP